MRRLKETNKQDAEIMVQNGRLLVKLAGEGQLRAIRIAMQNVQQVR